MLTVISPAKTLDFETTSQLKDYTQPVFLKQSQQLVSALKALSANEIASLMKVSDKLAGLNMARFQQWQTPFTPDNAKQAILAFQGDVYTGLDAQTLDKKSIEFAQQHLRILSGLYGVLKPLDLMQAYRLEMGTSFETKQGKDLYAFWGDKILQEIMADPVMKEGILINLASNEYFKAIDAKKLNATVITPIFKDLKNGQYKLISFYAKKARGLMSRYIIDNKIDTPEKLKDFDSAGYYFSKKMSQEKEWVFLRDH